MSTSALEAFIKKYQIARRSNSKEIRLTVQEAEDLSTSIALLLTQVNSLNTKIIELQDKLIQDKQEIVVSGGKF